MRFSNLVHDAHFEAYKERLLRSGVVLLNVMSSFTFLRIMVVCHSTAILMILRKVFKLGEIKAERMISELNYTAKKAPR